MKKEKKKKFSGFSRYEENKSIYVIAVLLGILFTGMILFFLYLEVFARRGIMENPKNNRYDTNKVIRGNIETIDGALMAYTDNGSAPEELPDVLKEKYGSVESGIRVYPYGELFTNITGYTGRGRTALESSYNSELKTASIGALKLFRNDLLDTRSKGNNVVTTIDSDLQNYVYNLLLSTGKSGSVLVMDAKTGAIKTMVTNPTYDANTLLSDWDSLVSEDNDSGQLLNRAFQGLYAPGSTFKIVTAIEYMRENPDTYESYHYHCTGYYTMADGTTVKCGDGTGHGDVDLVHSMAYSCNASFINMGLTLDRTKYRALIDELGFGSTLISDLPSSKSTVTISGSSDDFEMAQTAFGQGNTMETPLQNALITQMVANHGVMMKPYIVDHIENSEGNVVSRTSPSARKTILSERDAAYLNQCLIAVVNEGTTPQAGSSLCQVAGKSGTAQYESESFTDMHAWFTGYAPADDPEIVVTVMLEKGGSGSIDAGPLVSSIVTYYYSR